LLDERNLDRYLSLAVAVIAFAENCEGFRIMSHWHKQPGDNVLFKLLCTTQRVEQKRDQRQVDVLLELRVDFVVCDGFQLAFYCHKLFEAADEQQFWLW